jgi:hypothetical protein
MLHRIVSAFEYSTNMHYMYFCLIILTILPVLVLSSAPALTGRMAQSNGCGSTFTIDGALQVLGEGVIIPCCNAHDDCYETCGKTQSDCDNAFQSCLNQACSQLSGNGFSWWISAQRAACQRDGEILFNIVNAFGSTAYNSAQSDCPSG